MGRSPYQSEKRRKELARLKKQEEKRQRRFNKKHGEGPEETPDGAAPADAAADDTQPQGAEEGVPGPESSPETKDNPSS